MGAREGGGGLTLSTKFSGEPKLPMREQIFEKGILRFIIKSSLNALVLGLR